MSMSASISGSTTASSIVTTYTTSTNTTMAHNPAAAALNGPLTSSAAASAASTSARAIFPRAPDFTLEHFSDTDFIVRDFVEALAASAIPLGLGGSRVSSAQGGGAGDASGTTTTAAAAAGTAGGQGQGQAFDSKPLIRTFENALAQLASLSDELGGKEGDLLTSVRKAEIQHDQTLDDLGRKLDQSIAAFEHLDSTLNSAAAAGNRRSDLGHNVAVQIGERLEELDRQKNRAQDAGFLVQCWLEVSEAGSLTSLSDMARRGTSGDSKVRCAVIARQLMRMSQRLDPTSWAPGGGGGGGGGGGSGGKRLNGITNGVVGYRGHNTREIIEKFSETLEKDLLKQFDDSYRRQNFDDMMECAKVLYDFNGGASVVGLFVNQHQFFIDRSQLITDELATDNETWDRLADPDSEPPGVEPSLQYLVDEVRIVMQDESFIIKRAFPYHEIVLVKFIQRIFQQSVQQRLELVLEKADTISSLAFLRSLHASRSYINALVEDLKSHGLTEHPEACSPQTAQNLEQQLDELFVPYLVGNSYIDREKRSLEELYGSLLFKFTIFHSRRKKVPSGFMASLAQQGSQMLSSAKDAYIDRLESSELTPTQKKMMLRVAGLRDTENNKNEIEVTEEDGILNVPNAKRMLRWLAESVRRALELGSGSDTPKDVAVLLHLLLTSMGQVYVETGLDAAADAATSQEAIKTEPDLSYLPHLQPAITITNIMSRFATTVLIRLAEPNATVRRSMETQTKTCIERIENKTNSVIKATFNVIINCATKLLANQKKTDFRPKDTDISYLELLATPTCLAVCHFLSRAGALVAQALDGENLRGFSGDVALTLRDLLFEHFKRFGVNATGGLMLTKDVSRYVSTLRDWPRLAADAAAGVDALSDIGPLFIIGPEALRERARNLLTAAGGPARKLQKADFRAFVLRRDDGGSVAIQSVLAGL